MARVDILLATYNGERYLAAQLESLLAQDFRDVRILVRDDGSTDRTREVIADFTRLPGSAVEQVEDGLGNLGPAQNFGALIAASTAEFIMFCDQDDVWHPVKVRQTLETMERLTATAPETPLLVHSDARIVSADGAEIAGSFYSYMHIDPLSSRLPQLFLQNVVVGCTSMVNRHLIRRAAPFDQAVVMHDWWLALVAAAFGQVVHIPCALLDYRQHGSNQIGASSYGWATIREASAARIAQAARNYRDALAQADSFAVRYNGQLGAEPARAMSVIRSLQQQNWAARRITAARNGLHKSGLMRTALLYALM